MINSSVDVVILVTPPVFRPNHMASAVEAGKHVFAEKPACVDPVGVRSVMATGKKTKGWDCVLQKFAALSSTLLCGHLAAGRHENDSRIVSANCYWNTGKSWYIKDPDPKWSEMEYMLHL